MTKKTPYSMKVPGWDYVRSHNNRKFHPIEVTQEGFYRGISTLPGVEYTLGTKDYLDVEAKADRILGFWNKKQMEKFALSQKEGN